MFDPKPGDFEKVSDWPMVQDPFASVRDFSLLKVGLRWLKPAHWRAHRAYYRRRADWIGNANFEKYFETADRAIPRYKWEYLKLRKSWYHIPLCWEHFAGEDCKRIIDVGCGDGDTTQRIADFIAAQWKNTGEGHEIEIIAVDLGASRIANAKALVVSPDPRIKMTFIAADAVKGLPYADRYFDYGVNMGVLEIMEDGPAKKLLAELCRVTAKGVYIEDLLDRYPGGYPRNLKPLLSRNGFSVKIRKVVLTEPFLLFTNPDPCELWPILKDQIIWAERE